MAFEDYTDLVARVVARMRRTDAATIAKVPMYIQLAQARIDRDLKLVRTEVEAALTGVAASRFITLPTDYVSPITLWQEWPWGREERRFVPASAMDASTVASFPLYWTIDGARVAFERPLDQAYSFTLRYGQGLGLSSSQPTNWLLTNQPDVYFQGALAEGFADVENLEQAAVAEQKFANAIAATRLLMGRTKGLATLSVDIALRPRRGGAFNIYTGE